MIDFCFLLRQVDGWFARSMLQVFGSKIITGRLHGKPISGLLMILRICYKSYSKKLHIFCRENDNIGRLIMMAAGETTQGILHTGTTDLGGGGWVPWEAVKQCSNLVTFSAIPL